MNPSVRKAVLATIFMSSLSCAFDGRLEGPVLGVEVGLQSTDLVANGGDGSSSSDYPTKSDGTGLAWSADLGYAWPKFGLSANFSRRYFTSTMRRESSLDSADGMELKTTVHFPAIGAHTFFTHRLFGAPRHARISGEIGGMFINEQEVFKTLGPGYSLGFGQEVVRHVFIEARWLAGGNTNTSRRVELSSYQLMARASLY